MILCLGTTLAAQRTMVFDKLTLDGVNRAVEVHETASSKSINVALVVHELKEPVTCTGFLGGDTGKFIRGELDRIGIAHDYVEVIPATRTCVTVIDRAAGSATELVEESKPVGTDAWDALGRKLDEILPRVTMLVMSGTLPPGAPEGFYAVCVRRANKAGVRTIVDARGEALKLALAAGPLLVKPNRAELAATLGVQIDSDASLRDAIKRLIDQGPQWALVTMGADGAVVSDGRSFWRLTIPRVKAVSAIGSGDSLAAGLAVELSRGRGLPEACVLAAACGVANALTPIAGQVFLADVMRLREQVRLMQF